MRSKLLWMVVWVMWLGWSGCGFDRVRVGVACESNDDCDRGLFCDRGAPDGYCTAECSELLPCPNAALCGTVEGVSGSQSVTFQRCFQRCGVDQDCRETYHCRVTPGSQERICFPYASCQQSSDCEDNERCTITPSGQQKVCIPVQ